MLRCGKGDERSVFLEAWRTQELGWEEDQRESVEFGWCYML